MAERRAQLLTSMRSAAGACLGSTILGLAASAGGCAQALREPPPLATLASHPERLTVEEARDVVARADLLFATRKPDDVRHAAGLYVDAARAFVPEATSAAAPKAATVDRSNAESGHGKHDEAVGTTGPSGADAARALCGAARAGVWLTEHLADPREREKEATEAVQVAQWCARVQPAAPACSYWLGAALGVQARERPSTGLSALPEIEKAFALAAGGVPVYEEAGPDRALALLYLRAPGWPSGPGDRERGLEEARKAIASRPDYPPNQLALGEALVANGDGAGARAAWERAGQLAAKLAASGDPDAAEWAKQAADALAAHGGP